MQEFVDYNKKEFLEAQGHDIWRSMIDGRALEEPERYLSRFGLLVYADLKKYKFFYWFSFPAINYPKDVFRVLQDDADISATGGTARVNNGIISDFFSENALQMLQQEYDKDQSQRSFQRGYFIVKHFKRSSTGVEEVSVYPLTKYQEATKQLDDEVDCNVYFAYSDPSANQTYPGWPLRNYLCLIAVQFKINTVKIIRIRKGQSTPKSKVELQHSLVLEVTYQLDKSNEPSSNQQIPQTPLVTGWEKNESQHLAPKRVNLSSLLDPKKLAEDAVNLNLRLMKWRLLPGLNLDKIADTKCLLLGCGTLGCHIARGLLAWGIKEMSIVDNAKISYSNPVRQTLYTFDDCAKSNSSFKAEAAATSLRRIHPTVNVKPYVFSIPMPGHHIADEEIEQTKKDVILLERLIRDHDAIFLLMDTRESRWLPTVIAMAEKKLVINAAIGFDTFLLQRFGIRDYELSGDPTTISPTDQPSNSKGGDSRSTDELSAKHSTQLQSDQLGCYFCNDIVAPGDSTLDRTLDQQCTVSRPGVSMMVSAMAVELLASIVSSKLGPLTPAPLEVQNDPSFSNDDECGSELGIVPHSIRGNLARYHVYMPTSPSFNKCSACSHAVVNSYRKSGFEFLQRVFDDPNYLEEVAGLKDLQNISNTVWVLESDEDLEDLQDVESR